MQKQVVGAVTAVAGVLMLFVVSRSTNVGMHIEPQALYQDERVTRSSVNIVPKLAELLRSGDARASPSKRPDYLRKARDKIGCPVVKSLYASGKLGDKIAIVQNKGAMAYVPVYAARKLSRWPFGSMGCFEGNCAPACARICFMTCLLLLDDVVLHGHVSDT